MAGRSREISPNQCGWSVTDPDSLVIITYIPSPYQVELLSALSRAVSFPVKVVFCRQSDPNRFWIIPELPFDHCFLDRGGMAIAKRWTTASGLVVFGTYASMAVLHLISLRVRTRLPWAFWGERPGANRRARMGRILRAIVQSPIRRSKVPIWGIGTWATAGYRAELGGEHLFLNVPYYSDLSRFLAIGRGKGVPGGLTRFLYSGSLIERKGVDIVARAFAELAKEQVGVRLTFLGCGPLEGPLKAATAAVADRVDFLGFRQWLELADIYGQHDVLCAPSLYDGWGLIIPEGLAAGMPVIATTMMGATRDLLSPANGWAVAPGDKVELLGAMRSAAAQTVEERNAMIGRARESARCQHLDAGVRRMRRAITATMLACWQLGLGKPDKSLSGMAT